MPDYFSYLLLEKRSFITKILLFLLIFTIDASSERHSEFLVTACK